MTFASALYALWPSGDKWIPGLRAAMAAQAPRIFKHYNFDTTVVICEFMAQISLECDAGLETIENLNYSAQRMMQVWPSRFPNVSMAMPYAHNPRLLANRVYNGRMGNIVGSNDGWNFRGRGATQTTGRQGYAALGKALNLDLVNNPDWVNAPEHFLECGAADFVLCGCLPYAREDNIVLVTRHLNGGETGLADRELWLRKWKHALAA